MEKKITKISILCFANYCRSPVAEKILSKKFSDISFFSYGISPKISAEMDPRSRNYLKSIKIYDLHHTPRKVGIKEVRFSDYLLCMDHQVLIHMNLNFPNEKNKFKLFSFKDPSILIEDPYLLNNLKYNSVMEKIHNICSNIEHRDLTN